MASTFSTNLALELIGTGDQAGTWGITTNTNLGTLIEQAISGYVTQAVATGTDTTITIPDGATGVARNMYIELTGTGGASTNLIVPANKKLYFIFNNSTGAVTVKVSGQTGVSVPAGKKMVLVSNGTDIVDATNYLANLSAASANITVLTSASATITNLLATSLTVSGNTFLATSSGNVGIGTSSPTDTGGFGRVLDIQSASGGQVLVRDSDDTTKYARFSFDGGTTNIAYIGAFGSGTQVAFVSGGTAGTGEKMRLDSSGNLGIGTSSPSYQLDVVGGTRVAETAAGNGYEVAAGSTNILTSYNRTTSTWLPLRQRANQHEFYCDGVEALRLSSSGNLGLGVTPSAWGSSRRAIQIGGNTVSSISLGAAVGENLYNCYTGSANFVYTTNGPAASFDFNNATSGGFAWRLAASGTAGNAITFTQAMTLTAAGELCVATSTPILNSANRGNITVGGSASSMLFLGTGNGSGSYIFHEQATAGMEVWNTANGYIRFATNATERARITSGGDLLVGTTTGGGANTGITLYGGGSARFISDGQNTANTVSNAFTNSNSNNTDLIEFNVGQFQKTCIYVRNSGAGAGNTVSHIVFQYGTTPTTAGSITSVGTTVTYGSASDTRLKNDLGVSTESRIADVVIHDFEWKSTGVKAKGAFAQELHQIAPEAVVVGNDDVNDNGELKMPWQIDYSKLVPDLIVEIQALRARVAALEAK